MMRVNTKIRYAVRAMYEIAACEDKNGVLQKEIVERQKLSPKYLDHIISALKAKGLINNRRGKRSGLVLLKKPEDITVYDISRAFESEVSVVDCVIEPTSCEKNETCPVYDFWKRLNDQIITTLKSETLRDILNR